MVDARVSVLPDSGGLADRLLLPSAMPRCLRTRGPGLDPRREAGVQDVALSPALQNLLASPILPRGWWNQQLLLAIKQVRCQGRGGAAGLGRRHCEVQMGGSLLGGGLAWRAWSPCSTWQAPQPRLRAIPLLPALPAAVTAGAAHHTGAKRQ